jgi:hypothetical protein
MSVSMFWADATQSIKDGVTAACSGACNTNTTINGIFAGIANALIFIVGAISVIMIIIGGLRYATANGDSKATTAAKDTILYAVIGVVVAIASYAIVNFVVTHIK